MKLSVVIPCYNERSTIETVVEAVRTAPVKEVEIIVVDDGSTDGTRELLQAKPQGWVDKIVLQQRNFGKGAALRSGFAAATGDIILVQDADLEYNPEEYPAAARPDHFRKSGRRLRFEIHGRAPASGSFFLAHDGQPLSDVALEYVH